MKRHQLVAVAFCLLAASVALSGGSRAKRATPRYIEAGPLNQVVLAPVDDITLTCSVPADGVNASRVQWWEYGTVPQGQQISDMYTLLPGHPNSWRYYLVLDNPGQYDLSISPVNVADGTYYNCLDANAVKPDQTQLGAQLVIIEDLPNCTSTMNSQVVVEGEYFTMQCIMYFRSQNVPPLMTWTGPDPYLKAMTTTNVSIWSGISFTVTRSMDAQVFTCVTNFTQAGFNNPDSATNIPNWLYSWRSPQLLVHWGPKNMYADPDYPSYNVGTVITCFADAFPAADYFWQNVDSHETWASQSFLIREDMVGTNRMRCHAENYINSILYYNDYFIEIDVNPIPTTPTPGPITTTTTPPDESDCNDLTGQWQATGPTATMCVWLDYANNGVMTGLLKNDTDTYWNDLYGRVQLNTFDQGTFSSVSPGTIGITAYVLECKACYGVEIMVVSQIQRSASSATSCGDPGVTNYNLPDLSFHRVPTGPICTTPPPSFY